MTPKQGSDMPDTTNTFDPSRVAEAAPEFDDAAGYYVAGDPIQDTKAPGGPLEERWQTRRFEARIANPANRRRARPCAASCARCRVPSSTGEGVPASRGGHGCGSLSSGP